MSDLVTIIFDPQPGHGPEQVFLTQANIYMDPGTPHKVVPAFADRIIALYPQVRLIPTVDSDQEAESENTNFIEELTPSFVEEEKSLVLPDDGDFGEDELDFTDNHDTPDDSEATEDND